MVREVLINGKIALISWQDRHSTKCTILQAPTPFPLTDGHHAKSAFG